MKYTIVHIDQRAKKNMDKNKKILSNFEYVNDIEFFNGNTGNAWDVINHKRIKQDVWAPYDGRQMPPLPGELGIWVSLINVWEYVVKNKIDKFLVLEDDIQLNKKFMHNLNLCLNDLPEDFDFLSLYYFEEQNWISDETEIGSKYIHKSNNQFSAGQATVYSYAGCKKLIKLLKLKGIEYTSDCFIFKQSQNGLLKGYSIKPNNLMFLNHINKKIKSTIDPKNKRNT